LSCSFGGIHCPAGEFPGVPEPPGIGGALSFQAQQFVFDIRLARRRCCLLCQARRIVPQKRNLIEGNRVVRVIKFAFESLPIGGLRLIEAVKSDEVVKRSARP